MNTGIEHGSINHWPTLVAHPVGKMNGWSSINIYSSVFLERTGQSLKALREQS
jgi:hypothetical protein